MILRLYQTSFLSVFDTKKSVRLKKCLKKCLIFILTQIKRDSYYISRFFVIRETDCKNRLISYSLVKTEGDTRTAPPFKVSMVL